MLAKNFRAGERWRAQLRWEMFDTFNTPEFLIWSGSANTSTDIFGAGNFGAITATSAAGRRIMQFGLKLYW